MKTLDPVDPRKILINWAIEKNWIWGIIGMQEFELWDKKKLGIMSYDLWVMSYENELWVIRTKNCIRTKSCALGTKDSLKLYRITS